MLMKAAAAEMATEVDEDTKRQVCAMLRHLTSLHSPCQMLDSLVSLLKVLASTSDENNHCKSLLVTFIHNPYCSFHVLYQCLPLFSIGLYL